MKLIAYVGGKGSGKDTCALIAKEAGLVAGKIPFAGPLKRICSDVFAIPLDVFEHPTKKEEVCERFFDEIHLIGILEGMHSYLPFTPEGAGQADALLQAHLGVELKSPRHILQYVGSEMIRSITPDWHCTAAFSPLHLEQIDVMPGGTYAVTDCRFLNEYEFLYVKHDTEFHYVLRPEAEEILLNATHVSELEILRVRELIDSVLFNTGTLEFLAEQVRGVK